MRFRCCVIFRWEMVWVDRIMYNDGGWGWFRGRGVFIMWWFDISFRCISRGGIPCLLSSTLTRTCHTQTSSVPEQPHRHSFKTSYHVSKRIGIIQITTFLFIWSICQMSCEPNPVGGSSKASSTHTERFRIATSSELKSRPPKTLLSST